MTQPNMTQPNATKDDERAEQSERPTFRPVPEIGEHEGTFRLAHLAGMRLATALTLNRVFSPRDVAAFGLQVCEGLAATHAERDVHGSVRPACLIVAGGETAVVDAIVREVPVTKPKRAKRPALAVLRYRAPEQLDTEETAAVDARADIWALGAILYEMLTGKPAFGGTTAAAVTSSVLRASVFPLLSRRPAAPPELAAIIHRCLARDPAERFADVAALAAALEPFAPREVRGASDRTHLALGGTIAAIPLPNTVRPLPAMPTRIAPAPFPSAARRGHVRATLGIAAVLWLGAVGVVVATAPEHAAAKQAAPARAR